MHLELHARQLGLPAGLDTNRRAPLSLAQCLAAPDEVCRLADLTLDEQVALVSARWSAGEWSNVAISGVGIIDADRAQSELAARSELGLQLLRTELIAIGFAHEVLASHAMTAMPAKSATSTQGGVA